MKKKLWLVVALLCLLPALCGVFLLLRGCGTPETGSAPVSTATPAWELLPTASAKPVATESTATAIPVETSYVSPIDFDALRAVNPDIYAWLRIEGTDIDYPLVQSAEDDSFYLDHDSDGVYNVNGALFSENEFNGTDMKDPVTIIYGHHMRDGAMFGTLQQDYSDESFFAEHREVLVYTPTETLRYTVFAAVPYSAEHILYYHDFSDENEYTTFFDEIFSVRALSAVLAESDRPEFGDRVLILSTCLIGDNTRRYLVMAVQTES